MSNVSKLRVFYGFSKLNKIKRKYALEVYFENSINNSEKNDRFISKCIYLVHTRQQTLEEAEDANLCNRTFLSYTMFIDEKPFNGDIDALLHHNAQADSKNVSSEELEQIRKKLKSYYFNEYRKQSSQPVQLSLHL